MWRNVCVGPLRGTTSTCVFCNEIFTLLNVLHLPSSGFSMYDDTHFIYMFAECSLYVLSFSEEKEDCIQVSWNGINLLFKKDISLTLFLLSGSL